MADNMPPKEPSSAPPPNAEAAGAKSEQRAATNSSNGFQTSLGANSVSSSTCDYSARSNASLSVSHMLQELTCASQDLTFGSQETGDGERPSRAVQRALDACAGADAALAGAGGSLDLSDSIRSSQPVPGRPLYKKLSEARAGSSSAPEHASVLHNEVCLGLLRFAEDKSTSDLANDLEGPSYSRADLRSLWLQLPPSSPTSKSQSSWDATCSVSLDDPAAAADSRERGGGLPPCGKLADTAQQLGMPALSIDVLEKSGKGPASPKSRDVQISRWMADSDFSAWRSVSGVVEDASCASSHGTQHSGSASGGVSQACSLPLQDVFGNSCFAALKDEAWPATDPAPASFAKLVQGIGATGQDGKQQRKQLSGSPSEDGASHDTGEQQAALGGLSVHDVNFAVILALKQGTRTRCVRLGRRHLRRQSSRAAPAADDGTVPKIGPAEGA